MVILLYFNVLNPAAQLRLYRIFSAHQCKHHHGYAQTVD